MAVKRPETVFHKPSARPRLGRYSYVLMGQAPKTSRTSPSTKSPTRAAIGGISLLMVVAFAVQASAGAMSSAVQARQYSGLPTVRMIAEAVTRRVERQVRRQEQ